MLITDEEIEQAFKGTNFGHTKYRELLNASVFKKAVGYHCGWNITQIMKDLGLIGKNETITKRGKMLLRESYDDLMRNAVMTPNTKELIQDLIDALEISIEGWTYGFTNYEYDSDEPSENVNRDKILRALANAKNYMEGIE